MRLGIREPRSSPFTTHIRERLIAWDISTRNGKWLKKNNEANLINEKSEGLEIVRVGIVASYNIFEERPTGVKVLQRRLAEYLSMKRHEIFVVSRRKHHPRVFVEGSRACYVEAPILYRPYRGSLRISLKSIHWHTNLPFITDIYFAVSLYTVIGKEF